MVPRPAASRTEAAENAGKREESCMVAATGPMYAIFNGPKCAFFDGH